MGEANEWKRTSKNQWKSFNLSKERFYCGLVCYKIIRLTITKQNYKKKKKQKFLYSECFSISD